MTLIPWQAGKPVVWDVTVICTSADSCVEASAWEPGAVAKTAASHKEAKYSNLPLQYTFHPIATETQGPLNETASTSCVNSAGTSQRVLVAITKVFLVPMAFSDLMQFSGTTVFHGSTGLIVISANFVFLEICETPGTLFRVLKIK